MLQEMGLSPYGNGVELSVDKLGERVTCLVLLAAGIYALQDDIRCHESILLYFKDHRYG